MATSQPPRFTIVGAGPAGALMACFLARAGYRVDLYEKRSDPRSHQPGRGRSINLALSVRGIQALREIGLEEEVLKLSLPMHGRMIHSLGNEQTFQPYGRNETEVLHSVSRAGLNLVLIRAAARHDTVRLFFDKKCTGIDLDDGTLEITDEATQAVSRVPTEIVIGADGAFSVIRGQMQKQLRLDYRQDYESHGYKELTIPAGEDGSFRMDPNSLHIWPRRSMMMIALPNLDGSFTCTLFWPLEGPQSFASFISRFDLRAFFSVQYADAYHIMPTVLDDYFANPTGSLVTIRCSPWHVGGKVVLIGDACHAVVPFLGQGMNAAFEDCSVLAGCLKEHAPDWGKAFAAFEGRRRPHTDVLAELCIDNFVEMRDKVSSPLFRLKKKMQLQLNKFVPRLYTPLYNMIQFTDVPYAVALRWSRRMTRRLIGLFAGGLFVFVALLVWLILVLWR